jgi:hypothetical protein
MKFGKEAAEAAEELANVLKYNKYLLNNEEDLKMVIELRIAKFMFDAYNIGKESILVNDLSSLNIETQKGKN